MKLGIMSAMKEEIQAVISMFDNCDVVTIAQRDYYVASRNENLDVVIVYCNDWGKVSAAVVAQILISKFDVDNILFTGVAGAVSDTLYVGDVVVCSSTLQYDFNVPDMLISFAESIGIPLLANTNIELDPKAVSSMVAHCEVALANICKANLELFNIKDPVVVSGQVLTADRFALNASELLSAYPDSLCVEMEGGAVAQVCKVNDISCNIIRIISDSANSDAIVDFPAFVRDITSLYVIAIVTAILGIEYETSSL